MLYETAVYDEKRCLFVFCNNIKNLLENKRDMNRLATGA